MNDLTPYTPVSVMPAIRRDLSLCIEKTLNEEDIGDILRNQLLEVDCIESLTIKSETSYADLPPVAHERMGMQPNQKNILLQLIIRHIDKTLTDREAAIVEGESIDWNTFSQTLEAKALEDSRHPQEGRAV